MVVLTRAEIELLGKDKASAVIKRVNKEIGKLGVASTKTSKKMSTSFGKLSIVLNTTLGVAIGNIAFRLGTQFVNAASDAISKTLDWEQAWQVLNSQIDGADDLLLSLQFSTGGLVSNLDLVASANRAIGLGLEQETLPALAQTAVALGKIQGLKPSQAFNDIVTGIARASPLILDNLGIILDSEVTYRKYAESIGTTADALTKSQKALALQSQTIKNSQLLVIRSATSVNTLNDAWTRFLVNIDETKIALGTGFKNTVSESVLEQSRLTEATKLLREELLAEGNTIESLSRISTDNIQVQLRRNAIVEDLIENEKLFEQELTKLNDALEDQEDLLNGLDSALEDYKSQLDDAKESLTRLLSVDTETELENDEELLKLKREQLLIEEAISELGLTGRDELTSGDIEQINKILDDANKRFGLSIEFGKERLQQIEDEEAALTRRNAIERTSIDLEQLEKRDEIEPGRLIIDNFEDFKVLLDDNISQIDQLDRDILDVTDSVEKVNDASTIMAEQFAASAESLRLSAVFMQRLQNIITATGSSTIDINVEVDRAAGTLIDTET